MEILQIIMAAVICLSLLTLLWQARGRLLRSCGFGGDEHLTVTVSVSGSAPALEHTVARLKWLKKNGDLPASILLVDDGMDLDTAHAARLLANGSSEVHLCTPDQLEFFILRSCDNG